MPWKVRDLMSERYEFCQLALQMGINFRALCQRYGISRKTGYKWLKRYQDRGYSGLSDLSRKPRLSPNHIDQVTEDVILAVKSRRPCWGARTLRSYMKEEDILPKLPCLSTFNRILKRNGLCESRSAPIDHKTVISFERSIPNDLWQMDLKECLRLSDGAKHYPVGVLDDHSRYLLSLVLVPDRLDTTTLDVWISAAKEYGLPNETLTDHGSQFRWSDKCTASFRIYLWACDVVHTQGRVGHPQTQGKIERFWRTLKHEVLSRHDYKDAYSWQQCFNEWRYEYNHIRPHQGIGDVRPAKRYRRSVRSFTEPDRTACVGHIYSVYRMVTGHGDVSFSGDRHFVGRGLTGWVVELRPLGTGCWHVYFRNRFIKELLVTS